MGADLYIQPKFDEEYETLKLSGKDDYENLYSNNPYYFRDSYNDSSILWKLNLSWWADTQTYIDEENDMQPEQAKQWLELLTSREENMKNNIAGESAENQAYFTDKYARIKAFYQRAIDLNLPVYHSC